MSLDNLRNNLDKTAYQTLFNTEKIVKELSGRFVQGTDTTTRSYTLAASPNNVEVFRVAHGFDRPVFTEMLWSLDNSTFITGGGQAASTNEYAISYSDDTYVYIMPINVSNGSTVYYRLVYKWIDDYDNTTPEVDEFTPPTQYTQAFNSRSSTQAITDQGVLPISTASATLTRVNNEVVHNYNYTPSFRTYIEAFENEVWPLNFGGANNPFLVDDDQVEGQAFADTTTYTASLLMKSANGTRRAWYELLGKVETTYSEITYAFTQV